VPALAGVGGAVWDTATGTLRCDPVALAVLGVTEEEFDGRVESLVARLLPQDMPRLFAEARRVLDREMSFSAYFRIRHPGGAERWTHTQGHVVRDARGRVRQVIGIVRDARPDVEAYEHRVADPAPARQADMVQQLSSALAQAATVEEVTDALTRTGLLSASGIKSVTVCVEEDGQVLLFASRGLRTPLARTYHLSRLSDRLPLSEAIRTGRPAFFTDHRELLTRYPKLRRLLPAEERASYAILPLTAQGRTFGAVGLGYAVEGFSLEERTVLLALSATVAQSLQRALLYDKAQEVAAELQTSMLPAHLPQTNSLMLAARYRPAPFAHEVGGDWYDATPLPQGRTALVIGDVQGHDVRAAAVMGQLRTALRAYIAEGHSAAAAMTRASRFLADLGTDRFATCTLAVLNPEADEATIVRAGHLAPLVRHADGRCAWHRVPGGLPLGLFPEDSYTSTPIAFEPGATMVLCTDGLVESRTADIQQGKSSLLQALCGGPPRPEPLADHLLTTMGSGNVDDTAVLIAHRTRTRPTGPARLHMGVSQKDPAALRHARHALRDRLRQWGLEDLEDQATLLACELLTNALRHAAGPITFTACPLPGDGRLLRLEVSDASSTSPHRRFAGEDATGGRGMLLVEELATSWGSRPHGTGKTVWADLDADTA
jgi:serine phosphatase RsbU (regulator of sigma subunit)